MAGLTCFSVTLRWSLNTSQGANHVGAYAGFCTTKWPGEFLLRHGWDVSPLQGIPTPSIKFAGTHSYTWVERGTVRVKCLAQEQNTITPVRARTRTAWYGVERTNHEATASPRCKTEKNDSPRPDWRKIAVNNHPNRTQSHSGHLPRLICPPSRCPVKEKQSNHHLFCNWVPGSLSSRKGREPLKAYQQTRIPKKADRIISAGTRAIGMARRVQVHYLQNIPIDFLFSDTF